MIYKLRIGQKCKPPSTTLITINKSTYQQKEELEGNKDQIKGISSLRAKGKKAKPHREVETPKDLRLTYCKRILRYYRAKQSCYRRIKATTGTVDCATRKT